MTPQVHDRGHGGAPDRERRRADNARSSDRRWRPCVNMKRGDEQVLIDLDSISNKGGRHGAGDERRRRSLYGSLFMAMGKKLGHRPASLELLPEIFAAGVGSDRRARQIDDRRKGDARRPDAGARGDALADTSRSCPPAGSCSARRGVDRPDARDRGTRLVPRRKQRGPLGSRSSQIMIDVLSSFLEARS